MLPKLSAALNQAIRPVGSSEKSAAGGGTKLFEKFDPQRHSQQHSQSQKDQKQDPSDQQQKASEGDGPQLRVIPGGLGGGPQDMVKRAQPLHERAFSGASTSFLDLLHSLKQKKELFVKIGFSVYQKIRHTQGHGRIRKGSIVDEKV